MLSVPEPPVGRPGGRTLARPEPRREGSGLTEVPLCLSSDRIGGIEEVSRRRSSASIRRQTWSARRRLTVLGVGPSATARHVDQVLAPLGQDKWEQHLAHLTEQVDVAPTTVDEMVVQAAGGDARGDWRGMTGSWTSTAAQPGKGAIRSSTGGGSCCTWPTRPPGPTWSTPPSSAAVGSPVESQSPVPTTPARTPAGGTGARPRQQPGLCHTPMTQPAPWRTSTPSRRPGLQR